MSRTTATLVRGIIEVDATITDIEPFIVPANELVTECCTGGGHSATRLELIERWLAAHFYAIRDPRYETEKAGPVGAKYKSKVDLGFDLTHYGQTAMRLDTEGSLAALNKRSKEGQVRVVGMTYLGTEEAEAET